MTSSVASDAPAKKHGVLQNVGRMNSAYLFALPAATLLAIVVLAPIAIVIGLSFSDYSLGATEWSLIGIRNYTALVHDRSFLNALSNTALYVSVVVSMSVLLGLLLAILVHGTGRLRRLYEVIFFLPVASTLVALGLVWKFMLHNRIGPVNELISFLGFQRVDFFNNPSIAIFALAAIGVWHLVGFNMILFLAGLTGIPWDLYQAAAIDGADGFWDRLFRVTWPMLGPTTIFVTITSTITAFQVFDTVAVITHGGPAGSTDVILYQLYQASFQYFETGYASALTVVFLIIMMAISAVQIFAARGVHYS
ncbi:sugar ABC transporter permease [Sinorhizobium sp. 7-81]|uniref:carbohydrate ABC transporter permease n=1 Tax=Sinorhizobium sp. 8-89 TaxID=3049089 RepID=UPI0024C462B3|nr:sugar ABC transporter permease [Sinorhizobium sp. 8-89]MDK1494252.1 sugar ABC transporter permease [Sinorhizobium sp. 8-89]